MARYHISENGTPNKCNAQIKCRLGSDTEHFGTKEEAQKSIENKLSDEYSVSKSKNKNSGFSVPAGIVSEGYMGAQAWTGGNLEKLISENNNSYIDNKVIAKEVRNDIKSALKAGYLPKEINGNKMKYSIRMINNSMSIEAFPENVNMVDNLHLKTTRGIAQNFYYGNKGYFEAEYDLSDNHTNSEEVKEKLEKIANSYRYNNSNSMVDYFDTNFYPSVKVGIKSPYDNVEKLKNKFNQELVAEIKDSRDMGSMNVKLESGIINRESVNKLIEQSPKLKNTITDLVKEQEYANTEQKIRNHIHEANKSIEREHRLSEYDANTPSNDEISETKKDLIVYLDSQKNGSKMRQYIYDSERGNIDMDFVAKYYPNEEKNIRRSLTNSLKRAKLI